MRPTNVVNASIQLIQTHSNSLNKRKIESERETHINNEREEIIIIIIISLLQLILTMRTL